MNWKIAGLVMATASLVGPLQACETQPPTGGDRTACSQPINLAANGSFVGGLSGFAVSGGWDLETSFDRSLSTNPTAAPTGADGANYPGIDDDLIVFNISDAPTNDSLRVLPTDPIRGLYYPGELRIWFDTLWQHGFGSPSGQVELEVQVDGTTYLRMSTLAGVGPGSATFNVRNGARLGSPAPILTNPGGGGTQSNWGTVDLIVPSASSAIPQVRFVMTRPDAGPGAYDDLALDRIYIPVCRLEETTPQPPPVEPIPPVSLPT